MKLNRLESVFFERILNAELDVPVQATLDFGGDTYEVILVPELNENGQFLLKYYNAPAYVPETQFNEAGVGTKPWTDRQVFGLHPSLERAWLNSEAVTVHMHPSPLPIKSASYPDLQATVLYAGMQHRGALSLDKNQVRWQEAQLTRAEFSLVDFPEFVSPDRRWASIAGLDTQEREILHSLTSRLGDDATISIQPTAHHVLLESGNGWKVSLTRDEQQTRDLGGHTGRIEKTDGQDFESDELGDILDVLRYFFALVAGAYRHPSVIVGYGPQNRPIWGEIGQLSTTQRCFPNWFNNGNTVPVGTALERLFPMFWCKWAGHRDAMVAIVECYVHSNAMRTTGVPKDAVAKSYAGLEILASLELQKTIYGNSSEEIDQVLSCYQIPNQRLIRTETPTMVMLSENLDQSDMRGIHLLGKVRNYVAHPLDPDTPGEVKDKYLRHLDVDSANYFYLHDLSQFYLEYGLLKFLGFENGDSHRQLLEAMQQL